MKVGGGEGTPAQEAPLLSTVIGAMTRPMHCRDALSATRHEIRALRNAADMPVIVGVRLSLSFPGLIRQCHFCAWITPE